MNWKFLSWILNLKPKMRMIWVINTLRIPTQKLIKTSLKKYPINYQRIFQFLSACLKRRFKSLGMSPIKRSLRLISQVQACLKMSKTPAFTIVGCPALFKARWWWMFFWPLIRIFWTLLILAIRCQRHHSETTKIFLSYAITTPILKPNKMIKIDITLTRSSKM